MVAHVRYPVGAVLTFLWAGLCCAVVDFWQSGASVSRIVTYELGPAMGLIFALSTAVVWFLLLRSSP